MSRVKVESVEFLDAVSMVSRMKRSPWGGSSSMPKDTLISPAGADTITIETPAVSTLIKSEGAWDLTISVDARLIHEKTRKLLNVKKGIPNIDTLQLFVSDRMLHIKGLSEFSLPLLKN